MTAKISHKIIILTLLFFAGSVSLWATSTTLPQEQAKHFCQLMVCDNNNRVIPLHAYIRQQPLQQNDSLSIEQLFATYVFDYDGWQILRIFPHQKADGTVVWYSATDALPQDMGIEHQKYIHEVFPRLLAEIQAGNWQTADAYIERMVQYQCKFGATSTTATPSYTLYLMLLLFVSIILPVLIYSVRRCFFHFNLGILIV